MQLKISTDYAIRIVLYLAIKKSKVSLRELSESLKIDPDYVIKFCRKLSNEEIVNIDEMQDGFSLAKNPNEITMFDIIKVMENSVKINICLDEDRYCSRFAIENCPVRKFYCELQNDIENSLKSKTIHDLIST